MVSSNCLKGLNFGAPAAERDVSVGLHQYFLESDAYERVASGKRVIVLGNRGSGKSAIFKVLAERQRHTGGLVLELRPEDYSYEMLKQVLTSEAQGAWAKHGAYSSAWKYLILILVMKEVKRTGPKYKRGDAAKIYEYLRDHHAEMQDNPIAVLISYLKRIEGLKIGAYEASMRTRELDRLYKLEELEPLIPSLANISQSRPISVFVDELDRGWDASEDAQAFVAGLFSAAIWLNELGSNFRVYVSLRQELYDSIPALYEDAQKYRDVIEIITWDEPSLLALIAKRIRHGIPRVNEATDDECWQEVFLETIQYRKNKSFNYMIDRTLYRPRELIQFCTDALEEARHNDSFPIDYPVISTAELSYSEDRTKDIAAEYRFQYPGLQSVFEVFRGRTYTLSREELEEICLRLVTKEILLDKEVDWIDGQDTEFLIEVLWRVGFLRAYAVGGLKARRRSGSSYLGPHQVSNLNLRNIHRFQVHPMFRSYLGLKEAKTSSSADDN